MVQYPDQWLLASRGEPRRPREDSFVYTRRALRIQGDALWPLQRPCHFLAVDGHGPGWVAMVKLPSVPG